MSFRGRLTLFFLLIVVLPMVAVAVLVVEVTGSSRSGKADARLAQGLESGLALYKDDIAAAARNARQVARDPAVAAALHSGSPSEARQTADQLRRRYDLTALVLKDADGDELASAGEPHPVAVAKVLLRRQHGAGTVGSLQVSTTSPAGYLAQVRKLTTRDGALLGAAGSPVSSTLSLAGSNLPPSGHSEDVTVAGEDLRAATANLPGPGGFRLTLFGPEESGGFLSSSPLVIAVLVTFFAVALVFVAMLLRVLGGQVSAMLDAASRIGEGDFSRKVPVVGGDEMAGLASEFNRMGDRLSEQMDELRRQRNELERSVRRIGEAFASGFDREALLEIVLETALEACRADYGRVVLSGRESPEAEAGKIGGEGLQEGVRAAEERAARDGESAEARREGVHAIASTLRRLGDGAGTVGLMAVARVGDPFTAGEREVFLYLVGQASASIENVALHELVSAQAVTDELTGLSNNRRFRELIDKEAARAQRFGHDLSLVMLDIDDFKQVNDRHGHLQGDEVLRAVGSVLRAESRGVDEPARYGGEEFVVALPETGPEGAYELAERIRSRIEAERVPEVEGEGSLEVTASLGVASMPSSAGDAASLVAAADAALYVAKRAGKNRVEMAPATGPPRRAPEPRDAEGRTTTQRT